MFFMLRFSPKKCLPTASSDYPFAPDVAVTSLKFRTINELMLLCWDANTEQLCTNVE